jgi:hypothetical protein
MLHEDIAVYGSAQSERRSEAICRRFLNQEICEQSRVFSEKSRPITNK